MSTIEPATDEEIVALAEWLKKVFDMHVDAEVARCLLARIEAQRAEIVRKDEALRFAVTDPCFSCLGSVTQDELRAALSPAQPEPRDE